jgi:hypothetical protein
MTTNPPYKDDPHTDEVSSDREYHPTIADIAQIETLALRIVNVILADEPRLPFPAVVSALSLVLASLVADVCEQELADTICSGVAATASKFSQALRAAKSEPSSEVN